MNRAKLSGSMYFLWSVAIVACLLIVFFALIFSSCSKASPTPTGTPRPSSTPAQATAEPVAPPDEPDVTTQPTAEPTPPPTQLAETPDAGQEYIDRIVFLGDSTTNGLRSYSLLSGGEMTTQVWTPSSGTLTLAYWSTANIIYPDEHVEIPIIDALERKKPDILVITLGVNGVSFMDEDYFKSEYTKLVEAIKTASPDTLIICNSIYPVENDYQYLGDINNSNIPEANRWIYQVAVDTGTRYTDSASVLKLADGSLNEAYGNGDGIHLSADGYNLVLQYLRTHAYQ